MVLQFVIAEFTEEQQDLHGQGGFHMPRVPWSWVV